MGILWNNDNTRRHDVAWLRMHIIKVPIYIVQTSTFSSDSLYQPMNFCERKFDLDKMQSFLEVLKKIQICRHFGPPFAPVFPSF